MTKRQIINDVNFRHKCRGYGLDCNNFEIYGDIIVLKSPKKGIFIFLDQNYNIIGVLSNENDKTDLLMESITKECSKLYSSIDEKNGICFSYPFQNFSLKQMVELSDRIDIFEVNHGHSSAMMVNKKIVEEEGNQVYISLLSYIKFLGEQIKQYWLNLYQMTMMGFDYPDVYTYINTVMANINECVCYHDGKNLPTFPGDIIEYLGQGGQESKCPRIVLFDIISLFHLGNDLKEDERDISKLSTRLLKLLEIPLEEIMRRIEDSGKSLKVEDIDLKSWLEESIKTNKVDPYMKKI